MAPTPGEEECDACCPICSELYIGAYTPKQLPCRGSHTICVKCITKIKDSYLFFKCPMCLDRYDVPPGGPSALPTNRAIQEIAEKYHAASIKKGRPQPRSQSGGVFQIIIKTLTDQTITLDVRSTDTIPVVKGKLYEKEGIEPRYQYLVYRGKPLKDDTPINRRKTLADLNIGRDAVIHNMHKMKGGFEIHLPSWFVQAA
ncbi:uncharacterized protein [Amphiura filiformis]|uniref:uncharacterized protein n=1 Tax=Amphiura filiformis TaxID=82378 RepID=UPI003B21BA6E